LDPLTRARKIQIAKKWFGGHRREGAIRRDKYLRAVKRREPEVDLELVTNATVFHAQALYMRFTPITAIARETGLPQSLIQKFVYGDDGWKKQRESIQKEINEEIRQSAIISLRKATGISLELITAALENFAQNCKADNTPPSLHEAEQVASIFAKLHKAKVVEEISDEDKKKIGLSPAEILKAFGDDPYLRKAIEVSATVIDMDDTELEDVREPSSDSGSLADSI
jgi:DNA-binding transcriptional MerR regulator